jgi:type I restriction enzyme S subunit
MLGLERYDVGSSNPTLNRNHIHGLNIAIPTPVIQEKIADVLSIYDDLIENNRRRIQLLELAARMLYEEWFVHLRFPGHEHVKLTDGVPEGWEKKPLEDCVSVIETGSRPKGGVGNYTEGIPSIGAESIESVGVFDFSKVKYVPESYFARLRTGVVQDRDVLVYKDGGRPGHFIPHVSMFGNVFPFETMALNSHVYRVRGIPTTSQEFLYFHLSSDGMLSWMNNAGSGAAIPGIARKNLLRLPVLMPTHSLMTNFTEVACNCVSQILGVAQSSKKLADARDLLLPRLMTGEILV